MNRLQVTQLMNIIYFFELLSRSNWRTINGLVEPGFDERFIRPIRELRQRQLSYDHLLATVAMAFKFRDDQDEQSMELEKLFEEHVPAKVVKRVTQLEDEFLIQEIVQAIKHLDQ